MSRVQVQIGTIACAFAFNLYANAYQMLTKRNFHVQALQVLTLYGNHLHI